MDERLIIKTKMFLWQGGGGGGLQAHISCIFISKLVTQFCPFKYNHEKVHIECKEKFSNKQH